MNRQQALEWLVENVTKWPASVIEAIGIGVNDPRCWHWGESIGDMVLLSNYILVDGAQMSHELIITQQDWLSATDNMKERCDE